MSLQLTQKIGARTDTKYISLIVLWRNILNLLPTTWGGGGGGSAKRLSYLKEVYSCQDSKKESKIQLNKTTIPSTKFIQSYEIRQRRSVQAL